MATRKKAKNNSFDESRVP